MNIIVDKYELISLDIFDTLLLRAVSKPDDIFVQLWRRLKNDSRVCDITEEEFRKLRIEAERRARNKTESREVFLQDIYAQIPDFLCRDKQWMQEQELACEAQYCYANPDMPGLLQQILQSGKRVVLLSDMYLNREQISCLLEHNGIAPRQFDSIIISCENNCSKQSGQLYRVLLDQYSDIQPERILHIGDNRNSDYEQAQQYGINAMHYDVIPEKMYGIYDYEKIRHNVPQKELKSLRKLAASHYAGDDAAEKQIFELGASVAGPFLSLYIAHVVRRLRALDIHRIYPFMREGYLLGELLKREAAHQDYPLVVHPIYISRKVTYLPSIAKVNQEEIENMIGTRNLTVAEALEMAGLKKESFAELSAYYDMPMKESHTQRFGDRTLKEYIIDRLLEPEHIASMEQFICRERKKLITYLQQEIGDLCGIATIDIGFFGRIQLWMEQCLQLEKIPYKMKHFLAVGLTGDKVADGIDFEGYYSTFAENMDLVTTIHRTTDIVEKLISVTEGSTIGYRKEQERMVPLQGKPLKHGKFTDTVFAGILEFQRLWHGFECCKPQIAADCIANRREALMIMHRLIDMPRRSEAELLKDIEADTNFGTQYSKGIITPQHLALLQEKGTDYIDRCNVSYTYDNSNITWPKGVVTLADEFYYVRRALKEHAGNEILKSMQQIVEQVQKQGIEEIALYGAGENGRQFFFLCRLYHIKVACFIDRKESLWGTFKEGTPVMGLKQAIEEGKNHFIITSLFSIQEIEFYIRECFQDRKEKPIIFSV